MTPAQCRAARAFLDWTLDDLAAASMVSKSTLLRYEKGKSQPTDANLAAIQRAMEAAGIDFTSDGGIRPKMVVDASA